MKEDVKSKYMETLAKDIVEAIFSLEKKEIIVRDLNLQTDKQNQMLFFFKSEIFLGQEKDILKKIIGKTFSVFKKFFVEIAGVVVLSCEELLKTNVLERHYGYINLVSRNSSQVITNEDFKKIYQSFNLNNNSVPILGGHEFLKKNISITAQCLDKIWSKKKPKKIKSGLYAQFLEIDNKKVILLNGFHPAQLLQFAFPSRKIVLIIINSNTPWSILRKHMIGDSFPEKALKGSIRKILYDNYKNFGLKKINVSNTGVHLSASPFEAMYEINNFFSSITVLNFDFYATKVALTMKKSGLNKTHIQNVIKNPLTTINETKFSLFDITEDLDTMSSIELYKIFYSQISSQSTSLY